MKSWIDRTIWCAALLFATSGVSLAQMPTLPDFMPKGEKSNVKVPDFDVASVKPHKGDDHMIRFMTRDDGLSLTNVSVKMLVSMAYDIKQDYISGGQNWMDTAGFDVEAKMDPSDAESLKKLNREQRSYVQKEMMKKLLEDRFKLKAHIEVKTLPVYDLEVAKGGSKLKELPADPAPAADAKPGDAPKRGNMIRMGPGELTAQGMAMPMLASQLASITHRKVVDKTGLPGTYDLELKWAPEEAAMRAGGGSADNGAEQGPSIYTALQEQLGLKLQPSKGPVDTLVIDSIEQPTEN